MYLLFHKVNATPLNAACENGHHEVVQTLIGADADVNIAKSDVSYATMCCDMGA